MPSEKVLEVKKQQVAALKERIQNSCAGVIVNYEGISVADDTKLRKELREAGVEYTVIKNTLILLAPTSSKRKCITAEKASDVMPLCHHLLPIQYPI